LRLADALLKTDTPNGPVWHRYVGDGYGEHQDGRAYDGAGIGRGWPLLTGERGHYELSAGNDPLPYLEAMAAYASPGGMIPEQVWDADPIPAAFCSRPGNRLGDAACLGPCEFVKLLVSRQIGHPYARARAVCSAIAGSGRPQWNTPSGGARGDRLAPGRRTAGGRPRRARDCALGPGRLAGGRGYAGRATAALVSMSRCWRPRPLAPGSWIVSPGDCRTAASGPGRDWRRRGDRRAATDREAPRPAIRVARRQNNAVDPLYSITSSARSSSDLRHG